MADLVSRPAAPLDRPRPEAELAEAMKGYLRNLRADATWSAYRREWAHFTGWCGARTRAALPATVETVCLYVTDQAERGVGLPTLQKRVAAVSAAHELAKREGPISIPTADAQFRLLWRGVRRSLGKKQRVRRVAPITDVEMVQLLAQLDRATPIGKRNAALLLVGFAGALRRSELSALGHDDYKESPGGLALTIRSSKTDQAGDGATIGIARRASPDLCPVTALEEWVRWMNLHAGPIFRGLTPDGQHTRKKAISGAEIARVVKRLALAAGLDAENFSGHSLRAGHVTDAIRRGERREKIKSQTRHRTDSAFDAYYREADPVERGSSRKD